MRRKKNDRTAAAVAVTAMICFAAASVAAYAFFSRHCLSDSLHRITRRPMFEPILPDDDEIEI